jgi:DNA-binding transcriptional LysR family regulator
MELRQLEYFQLVCQFSSITKAAGHLHVAQPSISIAIQKLEEELGVTLFERKQRQITITSDGFLFLQRVNDILSRVQDSVAEMRDRTPLQRGTVKIGVPPMVGAVLFPPIFARFCKIYPDIQLIATERGTLSILPQLEQGRLDVGIITLPNVSGDIEILPLTTTQFLVCMQEGHPLSRFSAIPFGGLADQPFILFNEDTRSRQLILLECKKHHFTPRIIFSSSQIETIIDLVSQGVGISFFLEAIAQKHPSLLSRPLANPFHMDIALAWNKNKYLSNASKTFIDFVSNLQL